MRSVYQPILDAHFEAIASVREPDGFFHPSSMSGCDRLAVYEKTGTPKSDAKSIRNVRIMANGTRMHAEIQGLVREAHPGFLSEVEVDYGGVRGSCDGLLPVGDGYDYNYGLPGDDSDLLQPVYELQEYKSISPQGKPFLKGSPKPEHEYQARIYYWALLHQGYLLDGIRITYFDRDDWSVREFEVEPWTPEQVASFESLLSDLEAHAEEGTLPGRMDQDYWLCRFCEYRTRCWKQDGDDTREGD